ncbi:DUF2624 family protein [Ornithinibacillus sp. 4-3]|uniref:DUF2624 family protein n=1 Tax=Ornithinibacillus sp. 4-3 TaxID=3231488 RepID=A0AB39HHK3_9BACI
MVNQLKKLIQHYMTNLTAKEVLTYSKKYNISISEAEAHQIVNYLQTTSIDPFKAADREKMYNELENITNSHTAQKLEHLFNSIIKLYGLEHLFS